MQRIVGCKVMRVVGMRACGLLGSRSVIVGITCFR